MGRVLWVRGDHAFLPGRMEPQIPNFPRFGEVECESSMYTSITIIIINTSDNSNCTCYPTQSIGNVPFARMLQAE